MKFLYKVKALKDSYSAEKCGFRDEASLYGICNPTPPLADHIFFSPAPSNNLTNLINNYKGKIPNELLILYGAMNGANMFWTSVKIRNITIPRCSLSLYGIPLTYDRVHIEPFSLSIEDLRRPNDTPENWLKFGHYYNLQKFPGRMDLFVDTDSCSVYAVEHDQPMCISKGNWPSIDECLCEIFDELVKQV